MTSNISAVEVFTPRPRSDHRALHEQLLISISSTESNEAPLTPFPQKLRQRNHVQFTQTKPLRKPSTQERIKVDEVDDDKPCVLAAKPTAKARSRSRSVLRGATGPRSASRPARRRALSRGRPISRDTTSDQTDAPAMTDEEVARELRPESFTRFKRISLSTIKQKTAIGKADPSTSEEPKEADFEGQARAIREIFEQDDSPASLSPAEETNSDSSDTVHSQDVKLTRNSPPGPTNATGQEEEPS